MCARCLSGGAVFEHSETTADDWDTHSSTKGTNREVYLFLTFRHKPSKASRFAQKQIEICAGNYSATGINPTKNDGRLKPLVVQNSLLLRLSVLLV